MTYRLRPLFLLLGLLISVCASSADRDHDHDYNSRRDRNNAWRFINSGNLNYRRDSNTIVFSTDDRTDFDLRVVQDSDDAFAVEVEDRRGHDLAHEVGYREVIVSVPGSDERRPTYQVTVSSRGAVGRFEVYYRESRGGYGGPDTGYYRADISGNYTVEYPQSHTSHGECVFTQQGRYVRVEGRTFINDTFKNSWTGTGEWDGSRLTFRWNSSTNESGTVDATMDTDGALSGSYSVDGGRGGTVRYVRTYGYSSPYPADQQPLPPWQNSPAAGISGPYSVSYLDGTHGAIQLTQHGSAVELSGTTYSANDRILSTWTGNGTFDGQHLRFRWQSTNGRSGSNDMNRQPDGSLVGTFTVDGSNQRGSESFVPSSPPPQPYTSPRAR